MHPGFLPRVRRNGASLRVPSGDHRRGGRAASPGCLVAGSAAAAVAIDADGTPTGGTGSRFTTGRFWNGANSVVEVLRVADRQDRRALVGGERDDGHFDEAAPLSPPGPRRAPRSALQRLEPDRQHVETAVAEIVEHQVAVVAGDDLELADQAVRLVGEPDRVPDLPGLVMVRGAAGSSRPAAGSTSRNAPRRIRSPFGSGVR